MTTRRIWTAERIDEFAAMVADGIPFRECGRLLKIGESAAIGKAFRLRRDGDARFVVDRDSPLNRPRRKRKARAAAPPTPPQPTPPRPPVAAAKRAPMRIVWADPRQLNLAIAPCGKWIWDLEADECRWPIGALDHCARTVQRGSPYCACHHALAYRPALRAA